MNIQAYLNRIGYTGKQEVCLSVLQSLHMHHMFSIPFENLAIHFGDPITLDESRIYQKVVERNRGGFCYELNYLFDSLLREIGFETRIIAARIFDSQGVIGPVFDHLCLLVDLGQLWLVDVGFGDLFLQPIAVQEDLIQTDGRSFFKIEKMARNEFLLLTSLEQTQFSRIYTFSTQTQSVSDFSHLCQDKQTNPNSYFVKNIVCTKPTQTGRITLFNHKLIHTLGKEKTEYILKDRKEIMEILKSQFDITIE